MDFLQVVFGTSLMRRFGSLACLLTFAILAGGGRLQAQESALGKSLEMKLPLMMVNAASFDRLKESAGIVLRQGARAELEEQVQKWITGTLRDVNGFDRTRPMGLMFFIKPGLAPGMTTIAYLPVEDKTKALDTLATVGGATGQVRPVDGRSDRYEIDYGFGPRPTVIRVEGNYLFVLDPTSDPEDIERDLPDPEKLAARLTDRYDVAFSIMIRNVPPALKTIFREYFKAQIQAEMQQKDDEPDAAYRLRRMNGQSFLDSVDRIVQQGEEGTIGARIDPTTSKATLEFDIAGAPDSKLAKYFQDISGKRSVFANLLDNPSTLTIAGSSMFDQRQRKMLQEFFDAAEQDFAARAASNDLESLLEVSEPLFKTFRAAVEHGHFDAIFQMTGEEPEKYAAVAAFRLPGGSKFPEQVQAFMERAKEAGADNANLQRLEIAADSIGDLPVHRLQVPLNDPNFARLWGPEPHAYFFVSSQAIWLAFGGDAALPALRNCVDLAAQPVDPQLDRRSRAPLQFVTHMSRWIPLGSEDSSGPNSREFLESAFGSGGDAIRADMLPTDAGIRLTVQFEEGTLGWLGRAIGFGVDRRAELRRNPAQRIRRPEAVPQEPDF
jgi:hypothetical protein